MHELRGKKEQNKNQYHFVLICDRDKAVSIQGRKGGGCFFCVPSRFTYTVSSQPAGAVNIIIYINNFGLWGQEARKSIEVLSLWDCGFGAVRRPH